MDEFIRFLCPNCQKRIKSPVAHAGRSATCQTCKTVFTVPNVQNAMPPTGPPADATVFDYSEPPADNLPIAKPRRRSIWRAVSGVVFCLLCAYTLYSMRRVYAIVNDDPFMSAVQVIQVLVYHMFVIFTLYIASRFAIFASKELRNE